VTNNFGRALAASVGAFALIGVGLSSAAAIDPITDPNFQATFHIADAATAEPVTGSIGFEQLVVGILDLSDYNITYPIPAGATAGWVFVSPQGSESTPSAWNAKSFQGLTPGGLLLPNVSLTNQVTAGGGTPNGINAVKAAGGNYSIGLAFTKDNGINLIPNSMYFGHITVTAGTGAWTYTETEMTKAATTTTVTAPATAAADAAVSLSATVAPAAATGTVQFMDGAAVLGSPVALASGTATLNVAAGLAAGSHSITAVYSGNSAYAASTSAASVISITGTPVTTSLAVTASSASGFAGSPVVYTATVTPAAATGQVVFSAVKAGDPTSVSIATVPVSAGVATMTLSGLGAGSWTVTGAFVGTGVYQASSTTAALSLSIDPNSNAAAPDPQTVNVTVPKGALTITTPYSPANPLPLGSLKLNQATSTFELAAPVAFASATDIANGIKIVNERPDQPHFTAQVASTNFTSASGGSFNAGTASLINLGAHQLVGNALQATDVVFPTAFTAAPALSNTAQTFATYGASNLGTVWFSADFNIKGVPSSTPSGDYTATVTFTAF
jgi:hypothetical protein